MIRAQPRLDERLTARAPSDAQIAFARTSTPDRLQGSETRPDAVAQVEPERAVGRREEATARFRQLAEQDGENGRQRIELLERRFGDNEAIREIAARWNLPAQDPHNAYKKARKEFYRCLKEVVAFHRPDATDLDGECRELLGLLG